MSDKPTSYSPSTEKNEKGRWVTDGAWISGLVGVIALMGIAIVCQRNYWFDRGVSLFDIIKVESTLDVKLFCLLVIASAMCLAEIARLTLSGHKPLFTIAPEFKQGRYLDLILTCGWRYICYLALFFAITLFYKSVPEYGLLNKSQYYEPWFRMYSWLLTAFLWLGFPYVLLTYSLKYDSQKDRNSYHCLVESIVIGFFSKLKIIQAPKNKILSKIQFKKIILGLLVRVFFMPLMTVFFVMQFSDLVSGVGYVFDWLPKHLANGNYDHETFNKDMMNLLKPIIFSIDVALAWCGYVFTSRWLDNETQSTEPTLLGWFVCLISYPPLQLAGFYFYFPSEDQILNLQNDYFVTFFSLLMLFSFTIYTISTVVFGVRFSNLTHRGIIRTGPFALIRHPAYTSKNIGWWLGIFPVVLYLYVVGDKPFAFVMLSTIALLAQSYWYYLRAITEERHLSVDPAYQEYCKSVKYRFIPGVV